MLADLFPANAALQFSASRRFEMQAAGLDSQLLRREYLRRAGIAARRCLASAPTWPLAHLQVARIHLAGAEIFRSVDFDGVLNRALRLDPHDPLLRKSVSRLRRARRISGSAGG